MRHKILAASLPVPGIWNATEVASLLARAIRSTDRTIGPDALVQLPFVDGGEGTIDFLVTHSLGSFLEVEAHGPNGEDRVVPLGFAGEEGKLAVIEMSRIAGVSKHGESGTTVGVGEVIQDALDEGAFSIILGHEEPLAFDAGLGAAAALGVKFYDKRDKEIDCAKPIDLSQIVRVDASHRAFALLSSRLYIGKSSSVTPATEHDKKLQRLAEIIVRDTGLHPNMEHHSASAIEFGLQSLLGAEIRIGSELILEASGIRESLMEKEFARAILLIPSWEFGEPEKKFIEMICASVERCAIICVGAKEAETPPFEARFFYFEDVPMFSAPLMPNSSKDERQRDFSMRLEKLIPTVLEALEQKLPHRRSTKQSV